MVSDVTFPCDVCEEAGLVTGNPLAASAGRPSSGGGGTVRGEEAVVRSCAISSSARFCQAAPSARSQAQGRLSRVTSCDPL